MSDLLTALIAALAEAETHARANAEALGRARRIAVAHREAEVAAAAEQLVSLKLAAKALGISAEAVRKRAERRGLVQHVAGRACIAISSIELLRASKFDALASGFDARQKRPPPPNSSANEVAHGID